MFVLRVLPVKGNLGLLQTVCYSCPPAIPYKSETETERADPPQPKPECARDYGTDKGFHPWTGKCTAQLLAHCSSLNIDKTADKRIPHISRIR